MSIFRKLRRALRGEVSPRTALLESARRVYVASSLRGERLKLQQQAKQGARLTSKFAELPADTLLNHFRQRTEPHFFPGFDLPLQTIAAYQRVVFPDDSGTVLANAERILNAHAWPLLGLSDFTFVSWHRDPLSGYEWPLDLYRDIKLHRNDSSDVRLVWEVNRLGHFITLARAYALSGDERFSNEFFRQLQNWETQNPIGFGVNWNCAMEVAFRALNLLGAFAAFRRAPGLSSEQLARLLRVLDQHGRFICEHLEFSYVVTSNHYLTNVVGLLWLGIMLPELDDAAGWRDFGLRELLREMEKQVLPDGADCESATGYHRLVLELFSYSFLLCRTNGIEIEARYWEKLHRMFGYLRAYLRPDGYAPLLGDTDGSQVLPICRRSGNDQAYLLAIGAILFDDPQLKKQECPPPPELFGLFGEQGVSKYQTLSSENAGTVSQQFPDAGVYVLRDGDQYLLFNASDAGLNGRGSHGHNDALSIEVSACGSAFIVDPGTYVYTADLRQRHLFRSTAYHSTVQIDETEQNSTDEKLPFVIGNEAAPRLLEWNIGPEREVVAAEHYGYRRLPQPVTHRRKVVFNKKRRAWSMLDKFEGEGVHDLSFRFHFAPGLKIATKGPNSLGNEFPQTEFLELLDESSGARLLIAGYDTDSPVARPPKLEDRFSSKDYGAKEASQSAHWSLRTGLPFAFSFVIVPVCSGENEIERFALAISWDD
jgi:hypothetical protein